MLQVNSFLLVTLLWFSPATATIRRRTKKNKKPLEVFEEGDDNGFHLSGGADFTAGYVVVWEDNVVKDDDGNVIGDSFGTCTNLQEDGSLYCTSSLDFGDDGQVSMQGLFTEGMVITGGTEDFKSATGKIVGSVLGAGSFKYEIYLD